MQRLAGRTFKRVPLSASSDAPNGHRQAAAANEHRITDALVLPHERDDIPRYGESELFVEGTMGSSPTPIMRLYMLRSIAWHMMPGLAGEESNSSQAQLEEIISRAQTAIGAWDMPPSSKSLLFNLVMSDTHIVPVVRFMLCGHLAVNAFECQMRGFDHAQPPLEATDMRIALSAAHYNSQQHVLNLPPSRQGHHAHVNLLPCGLTPGHANSPWTWVCSRRSDPVHLLYNVEDACITLIVSGRFIAVLPESVAGGMLDKLLS